MMPHGGGPSSYRPPEMTQDIPRITFPERLCNRFGHAPAPDRPRSPTRTTPHPPSRAITPIPTGPGNLLARRAH